MWRDCRDPEKTAQWACDAEANAGRREPTPTYLVVFDDLQSEVRHRYDWVYHNRASGVACDVADKPIERLDPEFSGQEYLQHLQQGQTEQPIRVRFSDGEGDTLLLFAQAPEQASAATTITIGDGVGASVVERIPLALVTRRGNELLPANGCTFLP